MSKLSTQFLTPEEVVEAEAIAASEALMTTAYKVLQARREAIASAMLLRLLQEGAWVVDSSGHVTPEDKKAEKAVVAWLTDACDLDWHSGFSITHPTTEEWGVFNLHAWLDDGELTIDLSCRKLDMEAISEGVKTLALNLDLKMWARARLEGHLKSLEYELGELESDRKRTSDALARLEEGCL